MAAQLAFNFAGWDEPNENGVYVGCEVIAMPSAQRSLSAEIRIANAPFGFCWGLRAMFPTSGFAGMPNAYSEKNGLYRATRADAIQAALHEMLDRIKSLDGKKEAAAVRLWIDQMTKEKT